MASENHAEHPRLPQLTVPHVTRMCAGLLYEDVLVETPDVQLALKRLPKDVMDARELRLKRAMVLSSQQKRLVRCAATLLLASLPRACSIPLPLPLAATLHSRHPQPSHS